MKLNKNFVIHKTDEETVLVPVGNADFSGIVTGNQTFGEILELISEETTLQEVVAKLSDKYTAEADVIQKDVERTISSLKEIGAVDE